MHRYASRRAALALALEPPGFSANGVPAPGGVAPARPATDTPTGPEPRRARAQGIAPERRHLAAVAPAKGRGFAPRALDGLDWLARDHLALKRLFLDYERLRERRAGDDGRAQLAERICSRLSLHMQIEEETVYPARTVLVGSAALAHALLDHGGTIALIARLDRLPLDDPDFDATVAVLGAYVVPHMDEEEDEIFPLLQRAGLDSAALGLHIGQRLKALQQDLTRAGGARGWPLAACLIRP